MSRSDPAAIDTDDALVFVLSSLRERGPARYGQHGYHFTVARLAAHYVRDVLGRCHADPIENEDTYAVSTALYDAVWELARRGILRPSVHSSFMQFDAFQAAGGGYTLTEIGAEWLAGLGDERLRIRERWGPLRW
jgi:hypothetical protein